MTAYHVIRPGESDQFRRCRRAWDLGARERRNYEPAEPVRVIDFDEAVRDALDIYYFPGMWEWKREIVRPLAVRAFDKSMRRQRAEYAEHRALSAEQERDWAERHRLGTRLLERYFGWAERLDRFTPVQVAAQFDIVIPDPDDPDAGLVAPDGRTIQYRVRIDMVVMDEHDLCWLAEHRVVSGPQWSDLDQLILDEQSLTRSWAWQLGFLGRIEGTIHNELRVAVPPPDGAPADQPNPDEPEPDGEPEITAVPAPSGIITQHRGAYFRRTQIPRGQMELERRGVAVAYETLDMVDPLVRLYPNPSTAHCAECVYRAPCVAMTQGLDEQPILDTAYRKRVREDFELGRLGSVWGFVPETHRVADHRPPGKQ
ncbi:MAG TPA: hypothetical protein VLJ59_01820 [Mycobacteriales bacterium]|nr:hypothetical protein [Mycobacteriales bacterium]